MSSASQRDAHFIFPVVRAPWACRRHSRAKSLQPIKASQDIMRPSASHNSVTSAGWIRPHNSLTSAGWIRPQLHTTLSPVLAGSDHSFTKLSHQCWLDQTTASHHLLTGAGWTGAQDVHLDFHTAPELCSDRRVTAPQSPNGVRRRLEGFGCQSPHHFSQSKRRK